MEEEDDRIKILEMKNEKEKKEGSRKGVKGKCVTEEDRKQVLSRKKRSRKVKGMRRRENEGEKGREKV